MEVYATSKAKEQAVAAVWCGDLECWMFQQSRDVLDISRYAAACLHS